MGSILHITPDMLHPDVLRDHIYPNLDQENYWDDSWALDFYVDLARAGFISIAYHADKPGPVLLTQIQGSYAVLDWPNLHCSRNLRRLLRSDRLAKEEVELRIVDSVERVLERLVGYHGQNWILEPYAKLVRELPAGDDPRFAIHGVELWSRRRDEMVAGELGYTIGGTYTSLTGFCSPQERELRGFGTLQIHLLAGALRDRGYAFWNMGHPEQPYKRAIGARIIARGEFLERWLEARDAVPAHRLGADALPERPRI